MQPHDVGRERDRPVDDLRVMVRPTHPRPALARTSRSSRATETRTLTAELDRVAEERCAGTDRYQARRAELEEELGAAVAQFTAHVGMVAGAD